MSWSTRCWQARSCALWMALVGCGGAAEVTPEGADEAPDPGPRIVVVPDTVAERVEITTVTVEAVRSAPPIAAVAELSVDEHRYALVDAPAPGRVLSLMAHVGDVVEVGTPLVELASGDVGALRSELTAVRTRIRTAESRLLRRRTLTEEHLGGAGELESAEAELAEARAEQGRVMAALRAADARGTSSRGGSLLVRSPIAGTVLEHHAFPGEAAGEDDHLFEIADLSALWLLAHVSEAEAAALSTDVPARITFPSAPGEPLVLPVALVGRRVEAGSRTVEVRIDVENADGRLRPGMAASVLFLPPGDQTVLLVPRAAVQHPSAGWCVFVALGDHRYELRPILRGRDLGGEIEVLDGVRDGETIVTEGSFLLRSIADAGEWGEE